ncbi:Crp/Fnr family transcriptional regulator [Methylophaga sp. 41_12_T18]|nr:Crp/Fnr family transcriptional regulator [Methylophaga sp. 41_12_T18]
MASSNNVTPLFNDLAKLENDHRVVCQDCSLYRLCLPLGLHSNDLEQLDKIIKRSQNFKRGHSLFAAETEFKSLFVVRSGTFKTTVAASNGREQVTGFYFPGEFIGLDAIHESLYQSNARALETSSVCELPYETLQELGQQMPQLQLQLLTRLSKELSGDKGLMLLLGKKSAEEKLATFLLSLSKRFQERGFSAADFQLSMSRGDIANHLGLAVETISRLFSRFQEESLIVINGKSISLIDMDELKKICG